MVFMKMEGFNIKHFDPHVVYVVLEFCLPCYHGYIGMTCFRYHFTRYCSNYPVGYLVTVPISVIFCSYANHCNHGNGKVIHVYIIHFLYKYQSIEFFYGTYITYFYIKLWFKFRLYNL